MTKGRKAARVAGGVVLGLAVFVLGLEIVLRICPWAVPAKALSHFEPALRSKLAYGRFSTRADTVLLPRDDGGSPVRIFKPFAVRPYGSDGGGAVRTVRADEMGFGNPAGVYSTHSNIDIIAIGDSFTWPLAVNPEDGWPIQLGAKIGRVSYNLGRQGTGPYEYLQILKHFGLVKKPRVVIMNIYEGNDIRNAAEHLAYRAGKTSNIETDGHEGKTGFLWRHSYVWNLAAGSAIYLRDNSHRRQSEKQIDYRFSVGPAGRAIRFNPQQGNCDEVVAAQRACAGELSYDVFDEAIRDFKQMGARHGFTPILSYTPAVPIVYAPVTFKDPRLAPVLEKFSRDQRRHLQALAKEQELLFVDLTPALQAAARAGEVSDDNLLYFPKTIHLTARGHGVIAQALADAMASIP